MRTLLALAVMVALVYGWRQHASPAFEHPPPLAVERAGSGMKKFEFEHLFDADTRFEDLAKPGYYTVVEGYIDTCSVCRALERDLPALLEARSDVLVRRVHFSERGGRQFKARTQAELQAEIAAYAAQLKRYRSFNVVAAGDELSIGTCGTPHVEVYGPDGSLIVSDTCEDGVDKDGLNYLRQWIAAEAAL